MGSMGRIFLLEIGSEGDRERGGLERQGSVQPAFLAELFDFGMESSLLLSCGVASSVQALFASFLFMISKLNSKSKNESSSSSSISLSVSTKGLGTAMVEALLGFQNLRKWRVSMVQGKRETERVKR